MTAISTDLTKLTLEEQRQNLLQVARTVLADPSTLDMLKFHRLTAEQWPLVYPYNVYPFKTDVETGVETGWAEVAAAHCGTVHCIAGHAIANAGAAGFQLARDYDEPEAGRMLLGNEAAEHFFDDDDDAFDFLRAVVAIEEERLEDPALKRPLPAGAGSAPGTGTCERVPVA